MLRVEYMRGHRGWGFTPTADAEGAPHVYVVWLEDEGMWQKSMFAFVTKHRIRLDDGIHMMCVEDLRDPTTGVRYELTPIGKDET